MSVQAELFDQTDPKRSKVAAKVEALVGAGFGVQQFAENFQVLVDVAGSTKLLKELVLDLAMRGRLSAPNGEDAASLVAELELKRADLAGKGVRVSAEALPVSEAEKPYEIPGEWRWVRLRELGGFAGGGTPAKSNASFWKGPIPWVSPKDMKRPYIDDAEDHISMAAVEGSAVKLIPAQSVLYVVRGMILAHSFPVAVTTREVTVNQDMKALVLAIPSLREFVLRSLQAARRRVLTLVERSSHGTCRLESELVENLPIPLPPLAEQKRIVAKVDQLMALCDELEARQTKKRETGTRLTKSALEALTTAESPEDFDTAWKRVVENFDLLATAEGGVAGLRQLSLHLAFQGRLTRPGRTLVPARVRGTHQAMATTRGRDATLVTVPGGAALAVGAAEMWVPEDWDWVPLVSVARLESGHTPSRNHADYWDGGIPWIGIRDAKAHNFGWIDSTEQTVSDKGLANSSARLLPAGTVCLSRTASVGYVTIMKRPMATSQDFVNWVCGDRLLPEFLMQLLRCEVPVLRRFSKGAVHQTIYFPEVKAFHVSLPPLEEQREIIAKVEQLMKVCDELEARLRQAEDHAAKLVEAVVQELVA